MPERVGRNDGVGGLLMDGVVQRKGYAAFGRYDVVRPNIFQALRVATKAEAPLRLDWARGSLVQHFAKRLPLPLGQLAERGFGRGSRSCVPVAIKRHVG